MSKKSRYRGPFDKQHGKRAKALLKFPSKHLYHIHWSLPSQLSWWESLFLTCKIFRLLVNTLAANEKYLVLNKDNLSIPIQIELSQKKKLFLIYLPHFWNFDKILIILKQNITLIDFVFPTKLTWQWPFDMIKVLWCRFRHCWGMFTMVLVEGFSQTQLFRHLSDHVFGVRNFGNTKWKTVIFFSKCLKVIVALKNAAKKWGKVFIFEITACELVSLNCLY